MLSVAPLYHRYVKPATIVAIYFFPSTRLTVTTGKGYLLPIDKMNLLSNFGSFSVESLYIFFLYVISHYVI